jgi:hypothetical protein
MKKFKNNKIDLDTWCGQQIEPSEYYTLQSNELFKWQNDPKVLTDLGSGDGIMNDGTNDIAGSANAINFLKDVDTNPRDADGAQLVRVRAFSNPDNLKFRGTGIESTATLGVTSNIDYKLTENRYLNGLQIILKDHFVGDNLDLQVIDKDNILGYGANTVLDQFGTSWFVAPDVYSQGLITLPYAALVAKDLYIRLKYNSKGTTDVKVFVNLFLHKKP